MNGIQDQKALNIEKPFPGCLGRVVNLFDLSAGMPENRMLTDKPHGNDESLFYVSKLDLFAFQDFSYYFVKFDELYGMLFISVKLLSIC